MNKNYRLLSFRSFFIFFIFIFFRGVSSCGFERGGERPKIPYSRRVFLHSDFFFHFFFIFERGEFFFLEGGYGEFSVFKKRGVCARHAQNHNYYYLLSEHLKKYFGFGSKPY